MYTFHLVNTIELVRMIIFTGSSASNMSPRRSLTRLNLFDAKAPLKDITSNTGSVDGDYTDLVNSRRDFVQEYHGICCVRHQSLPPFIFFLCRGTGSVEHAVVVLGAVKIVLGLDPRDEESLFCVASVEITRLAGS